MSIQQLESVLSAAQKESIEISDFIFHIIDPDTEGKVIKLDEVQLHEKQKNFFIERLKDIAEGTQYIFNSEVPNISADVINIMNNRDNFAQSSFELTSSFSRLHFGNMASGVFIVAIVRYLAKAHDWKELLFLVKMDQQESFSYSYKEIDGRKVAVIDEVPNSLSENKAAIQKSALIDATDHFAWDVLAHDRAQKPELGRYYREFLGVTERQQDSALTRNAHKAVRQWAKAIPRDDLPENEDLNSYLGRAYNYLSDHDDFDTDEFINAVVRDQDSDRKKDSMASLREVLGTLGVAGQNFKPKPDSLPKKQRNQVYETAEGVTITFTGTREAAGVNILYLEGNAARVTIVTDSLTPKE